MDLQVYDALRRINFGVAESIEGLTALRRHPAFARGELDRLAAMVQETRASLNSYLAGAIEVAETNETGRWYGKRRRREKREDATP